MASVRRSITGSQRGPAFNSGQGRGREPRTSADAERAGDALPVAYLRRVDAFVREDDAAIGRVRAIRVGTAGTGRRAAAVAQEGAAHAAVSRGGAKTARAICIDVTTRGHAEVSVEP